MKIRKQKNANTKLKKRNLLDGLSMRADMKEYRINMMNLKNKIYRIDLILKTEKMEWKKKNAIRSQRLLDQGQKS